MAKQAEDMQLDSLGTGVVAPTVTVDLAAVNAALTAENEGLKKALAAAETAAKNVKTVTKVGKPEVTVGAETYTIEIALFNFQGELKTTEDVQADEALAAELVGTGVLKLKEKEE